MQNTQQMNRSPLAQNGQRSVDTYNNNALNTSQPYDYKQKSSNVPQMNEPNPDVPHWNDHFEGGFHAHDRTASEEFQQRNMKESMIAFNDSIRFEAGGIGAAAEEIIVRRHSGKNRESSLGTGVAPRPDSASQIKRIPKASRGPVAMRNKMNHRSTLTDIGLGGESLARHAYRHSAGAFKPPPQSKVDAGIKLSGSSLIMYPTGYCVPGKNSFRTKGVHEEHMAKCGEDHIRFIETGLGSDIDAFEGQFRGRNPDAIQSPAAKCSLPFPDVSTQAKLHENPYVRQKGKSRSQLAEKMLKSNLKFGDKGESGEGCERKLFTHCKGAREKGAAHQSQITKCYMGGQINSREAKVLAAQRNRSINNHIVATKANSGDQIIFDAKEESPMNIAKSGLRITGKQARSQISESMFGGEVFPHEYKTFAHEFENKITKGMKQAPANHYAIKHNVVFGDDGARESEGFRWRKKHASHDKSVAFEDKLQERGLKTGAGMGLVDHIRFGTAWGLNAEELKDIAQRSGKRRFVQDNLGKKVIAQPDVIRVKVTVPPGPLGVTFAPATDLGDGAVIKEFSHVNDVMGPLQSHPRMTSGMRLEKVNFTQVRDEHFTVIRKLLLPLINEKRTFVFTGRNPLKVATYPSSVSMPMKLDNNQNQTQTQMQNTYNTVYSKNYENQNPSALEYNTIHDTQYKKNSPSTNNSPSTSIQYTSQNESHRADDFKAFLKGPPTSIGARRLRAREQLITQFHI